jgi:putative transposase
MNKPNFKTLKHYNTPGHAHELTFSCYRRQNYLNDHVACELFLSELEKTRDEHQFRIWAYVLMPNHVHLLIWPMNETYAIDRILNNFKGKAAKKYRDFILATQPAKFNEFTVKDNSKKREVFRFWQPGGGFDRNLWNAKAIHDSIGYIEANPVRKKLSATPGEYRWSSANARVNNVGLIPDRFDLRVVMLDPQQQRIGIL